MRTQITLVGRLGRDPESRTYEDNPVCSMAVAVNRKAKGEEVTDWFNVTAWGKLAELCGKYLSKGREVVVVGGFEPRFYEKDGEKRISLDVRANEIQFLGEAKTEATQTPTSSSPPSGESGPPGIPFF